ALHSRLLFRLSTSQEGFREEDCSMPPACDEFTFRLYVPITFQKNQAFGPQSRARLLKTFGWQTGDDIVRNDEVVGSIPTSSTISQRLTGTDFKVRFTIFATMRSSVRSHHFSMTYGHLFCDYVPQLFQFSSLLITY